MFKPCRVSSSGQHWNTDATECSWAATQYLQTLVSSPIKFSCKILLLCSSVFVCIAGGSVKEQLPGADSPLFHYGIPGQDLRATGLTGRSLCHLPCPVSLFVSGTTYQSYSWGIPWDNAWKPWLALGEHKVWPYSLLAVMASLRDIG